MDPFQGKLGSEPPMETEDTVLAQWLQKENTHKETLLKLEEQIEKAVSRLKNIKQEIDAYFSGAWVALNEQTDSLKTKDIILAEGFLKLNKSKEEFDAFVSQKISEIDQKILDDNQTLSQTKSLLYQIDHKNEMVFNTDNKLKEFSLKLLRKEEALDQRENAIGKSEQASIDRITALKDQIRILENEIELLESKKNSIASIFALNDKKLSELTSLIAHQNSTLKELKAAKQEADTCMQNLKTQQRISIASVLKTTTLSILLLAMTALANAFPYKTGFNEGDLEIEKHAIVFDEASSNPSTPDSDKLKLFVKDNGSGTTTLYQIDSTGSVSAVGAGGGSSAPTDATYITQTSNGSLSAEQALGSLATGIVKNTTTTGVLSIASSGSDYVVPGGNVATATALAANGSNCSAGSAPLGVDASGAVESCTDFEEDLSNSAGLAAAISDETGTGVAVFGTGPTISLGQNSTLQIGSNPTVDAGGEVGVDTSATSGAAFTFYADGQYTIPGWRQISFSIPDPTSASDFPIIRFNRAVTIKAINTTCVGGTNVVGGLDEGDSNGANGVAIDSDITATCGTDADDDGSLSNSSLDANDWLIWHTTSVSGVPTSHSITVWFTYDAVA